MKTKIIIISVLCLFLRSISFSQAPLAVGRAQLNAGVGLSGWGIPVYIGFDYGVKKDFTMGAEFSFRSYGDYYHDRRYRHSIMGIAGNANYHFNSILKMPSDWDFYAGLNIGAYFWDSPRDYDGPHTSGVGLGLQVGGRYFVNKNFGLNLELGGSTVASGGKFGITYLF